jgi:DNA-binding CsgD family transcriptional regulator
MGRATAAERERVPARAEDLLSDIDKATATAAISARLAWGLPQLLGGPMSAFLLFCGDRNLALLDCHGREGNLAQRYRERGLPHDDVLQTMILSGEPVHDMMLRNEAEWRAHPFYTGFSRPEGLFHYGGSPILADGCVRGAILCARAEGTRSMDTADLLVFATIALHVQGRLAQLEEHVPKTVFQKLTKRQLEVCEQIAQGQSNREVAARLHVGTDVIKWHLKHIFALVGVESRDELAAQFLFWHPAAAARAIGRR